MKQTLSLPHCVTHRCSKQMEVIKHNSPHALTMLPNCSHRITSLVGIIPPRMKFRPLLLPAQLFPESVLFCWIEKKEVQMGNQDNTGCFKGKCQLRKVWHCFFHLVQIFWFLNGRQKVSQPIFVPVGTAQNRSPIIFFPNQLLGLYRCYKKFSDSGPGLTSGQPALGVVFKRRLLESERLPSARSSSTYQSLTSGKLICVSKPGFLICKMRMI